MKPHRPFARSVVLISMLSFLNACSGGGGNAGDSGNSGGGNAGGGATPATAPAAPTLALNPTAVKAFRFTWTDVSGETEYRLLEDVTGSAGYTQIATPSADTSSYDLIVPLPKRVNARYILQACNAQGCADSAPVSVNGALVAAIGYVKASNTEANDAFGYSVALAADGDTLAVGALYEDSNGSGDQADNTTSDAGAVYIYTRGSSGTAWTQQAYIKAANAEANDNFGFGVALSGDGNTLAVGAPKEDSSATSINGGSSAQADNGATDAGAVYVFTRSANAWTQQAYVKASNTGAFDNFGSSLAISSDGNTLAVGAYGEASNATGINSSSAAQADNSAAYAGAVYVFARGGNTWTQQAYVKASNTGATDSFGYSVALAADGNTLAVGANYEASNARGIDGDQNDDSVIGAGAVYVFTRSGIDWTQQAYVKASNAAFGDGFGYSVALAGDGNTLAVGAPGEDSNATGIGGDQNDNRANDAGAVYVFTRSGIDWTQQAYVKASNSGGGDTFGASVTLSGDGNTLAVGAYAEDSNATGIDGNQADNSALEAGAAYVFARSNTVWEQQAYVKAANTGGTDAFGLSVALAGDSITLAVGAAGEAGNATGINGDQADNSTSAAGAVYLF